MRMQSVRFGKIGNADFRILGGYHGNQVITRDQEPIQSNKACSDPCSKLSTFNNLHIISQK